LRRYLTRIRTQCEYGPQLLQSDRSLRSRRQARHIDVHARLRRPHTYAAGAGPSASGIPLFLCRVRSMRKGSGPLDAKTVALVKLAISLGAGLEGAAHSHARKALEAGWTGEQLLHAALLCTPTIGFPPMMRGRGWVEEVVGESGGTP